MEQSASRKLLTGNVEFLGTNQGLMLKSEFGQNWRRRHEKFSETADARICNIWEPLSQFSEPLKT